MKKKLVSLLTMFCLVLPCFFAVACKDKEEDKKPAKAYTYSVVLKNAKGKIDENALHTEYDYKEQKNVSWTSSGDDYSVSVTRNSTLSDSLNVSLLEGFDYSNLSFSVNSKDAEGEIKSGSKTGCEKDAYLTDRQFCYSYTEMKTDTALVVDFTDCAWAKISLDFSELASQGITCYTTASNFATINTAVSEALDEVTSETVEVDYGTIFAFDCAQKLVFEAENSENFQDMKYAKYASKYYLGTNMIQYFTAKQDGDCRVYDAVKDYSKRETLRILDCAELPVFENLDDLQNNNNALETTLEKESYGGSLLSFNVVSATKMFINLDSDADDYNYYVVDSIDGYMSFEKMVEQKTLTGTEIVYLEIDIASDSPAKYLVRAPKTEGDYYIVGTNTKFGEIEVVNADYIMIGQNNIPSNRIPNGNTENIFFGFKNTNNVDIALKAYTSDTTTDFVLSQSSVSITTKNISQSGSVSGQPIIDVIDTVTSSVETIDCFDDSHTFKFYQIDVLYQTENFSNALVTLDASDFEVYEDETVYYTTDITDENSWSELTSSTELSISSEQTRTIYYYIVSNRADAFLQIQNPTGEVVSMTSEIRDCFGRQMTGTITVGDVTINCSKIRYLDIKPGSYSSYTAKILREYDKTYHGINLAGLGDETLMVSIGSYTASSSSFKNVSSIANFNIKYNGQENSGAIYYYLDSETNKYLVLKDAGGNIVSASVHVMESVSKELEIDGKYVYRLDLVGDYYDENETFTLHVVDSLYGLKDNSDLDVEIFDSIELTNEQTALIEGNDYYFVGEEGEDYDIIDAQGFTVIDAIQMVQTGASAVYKFTFTFPASQNYVDGTNFKLILRA